MAYVTKNDYKMFINQSYVFQTDLMLCEKA